MILKKINHLIFFFTLLTFYLIISSSLYACKSQETLANITKDSIPTIPKYTGYRLQVTQIKVEKNKGDKYKINCTLINTGREKIQLPLKTDSGINLIFQYDQSLDDAGLRGSETSIESAILKKKVNLNVGAITSNFSLKFNASKTNEKGTKQNSKASQIVNTNPSSQVFDKEYCPDLRIDTMFIEKRSKRWVELAFKITNYGKGPAPMFGETKEIEDNVVIKAYASGTPKLSRGDLVLGGAFIETGIEDKNGILMPNESFSGAFRVETKKKTRYMPYFILSIDDYQVVWECNEGNNTKSLQDRNR